jgi:hypothetical protein
MVLAYTMDDPEAAAVSGKIAASSFCSPVFAPLAECNSHTDPALRWCWRRKIWVTVNPKSPTDLKYEYIPFVQILSHLS